MTDNIENLLLEHLKRMQADLAGSRERDQEILIRLSRIESGLARITRDQASDYSETVEDRHALDRIKERLERIEKRLELQG